MSPSKTESNYPMNTDPIPSKHFKKNMKISIFTFKTNEKKIIVVAKKKELNVISNMKR